MLKSISILLVLNACVSLTGADEVPKDILRFKNGDQLHGDFLGFSQGPRLDWNRGDLGGKITFETTDIRQVVLQAGANESSRNQFSHLGTVNGDRIPGRVTQLDDDKVFLETPFGRALEIPREQVGLIAPQPLGGRVLYHGPFLKNEWTMLDAEHPDGLPPEDGQKDEQKDGQKQKDKDPSPRWVFSGSAWYWPHESSGTALVRKDGLPDRAVIKFDIAWKNRLSVAIAFHANFKRPIVEDGDDADEKVKRGNRRALPDLFGESYVLHLYSNYLQLYRTGFNDKGDPILDRLNVSNGEIGLSDASSATIEIRCNRLSGEVMLFINDAFVLQWVEPATDGLPADDRYQGKGEGFGFLAQNRTSPLKISEIVVAEWNGMPDAARSMQVESSDIVLLTNGTDRFSGNVTKIEDNELTLEGRYGDFIFPMEEVAEIRFASEGLANAGEDSRDSLMVRLQPIGRISGRPLDGPPNQIRMHNQAAGEIEIDLDAAVMLEFDSSKGFIDDWNVEF